MNNPITILSELISRYRLNRRRRRAERLEARVRHEVQVGEYRGMLFITFRGVPLLAQGDLYMPQGRKLTDYVSAVRSFVTAYYKQEEADRNL